MQKWRLLKYSCMALVVALSVFAFGNIAMAAFSDVPESHWAANNISIMSELGVVGGYTDGTFRPNATVNQVEALSMAVRAMGLEATQATDSVDVPFPVPAWAEENVMLALQHGLLAEDDQFSAYSGASRAWVARLLVRMIGKESEAEERLLLPNFTDANIIPDWALYYVRVAQDYDLIAGYSDGSFKPDKEVSRAELVTFLSRAMDELPQNELYQNDLTQPQSGTGTDDDDYNQTNNTINGTIVKVYPENNAFVVEDTDGNLKTIYLPGGASISVTGSSQQGLNALQPGDEVEVGLNAQGYAINIVVRSRTGMVDNEGVVYDLDLDTRLLILQSASGSLSSFRLSDYASVRADGIRFPSVSDIREGDRVRVTVQDGWVTLVEVLELASQSKLTGEVLVLDEDKGIINLDVDGQLYVYRLSPEVYVTSNGSTKVFLSDVDEGDTVTATVDSGEVVALNLEDWQEEDSFDATVYAVDSENRVLTLKDSHDNLKSYDVLEEARITIDGKDDTLSGLERDMEVTVHLLDGDIIIVEMDNTLRGTVSSIDEEGLLLVLQRDNGQRETYVLDKKVDVESKDGRDELEDVKRGDYVEIELDDNRVEEINLRTRITCRVDSVREAYDRLEVTDEDGDSLRLYLRGDVDLVVPGVTYPDLDDVYEGDLVRATYLGRDLDKVEVVNAQPGEVVAVDTISKQVTVKLFDGSTREFYFTAGSSVNSNGRSYDSITALDTGDRVYILENPGGGYSFLIMDKISGSLAFDMDDDEDRIYLQSGSGIKRYNLSEDVYVHNTYGTITSLGNIKKDRNVDMYMLWDMVYEVLVK